MATTHGPSAHQDLDILRARLAFHRDAVLDLTAGIFERKPWLVGVCSFTGPVADHREMVALLERRIAAKEAATTSP
jgi:hypothetical protein